MRFEDIVPSIPLDEASDYFLRLKYAGARQPSEDQVVEAFKGLSKEAQAEILKEAGLTKEAIIGPMADLQGLGIPSLVGYHLGKSQGSAMARAGDAMDERSIPGALLVPGALGYRYGKEKGYNEAKAGKGEEKKAGIANLAKGATSAVDMAKKVAPFTAAKLVGTAAVAGGAGYALHKGYQTLKKDFGNQEKRASDPEQSLEEYLSQEQSGMAAQQDVERQYLGQRVSDMNGQMQQQQAGQQETSMQMQQMQQQLAQSNQQIQMAQQTAAAAQQQALQAQQQQLAKADESLRTQQMAAQMRTAYQELRGQLMNLATNDPAMSIGNELKGQGPEMGPEGMGAPPMGAPGMEGQPGATQDPNAVPPPDGASGAPPGPGPGEEPAAKMAGLMDAAAQAYGKVTPHHALGVAAGAGAGSLLAQREAESGPERHKASLKALQSEPGGGGFLNALQQAKAKALLSFSEAARAHPTAANLAGTAIGGAIGAGAGESIKGLMTTPKY